MQIKSWEMTFLCQFSRQEAVVGGTSWTRFHCQCSWRPCWKAPDLLAIFRPWYVLDGSCDLPGENFEKGSVDEWNFVESKKHVLTWRIFDFLPTSFEASKPGILGHIMTHKDATFQHILIMTWRLTCFIVLCGWLNIGILPKSLSSLWWIEGACGLSEAPWPDGHNFDSYVSCSRPWLKASRSWYGSCYWCSSSSMSMVWFWRKVFGTVAQMTKRHWCVGNLVTCSPPKWPCIKSFTADCCGVSFGMNCKKWRGTSGSFSCHMLYLRSWCSWNRC